MLVTADQIVAHLIGDFVLQSHWMATEKSKTDIAALAHAFTYCLPFIFVDQTIATMLIIFISHFLIDRYRLSRHLVWFKNLMAPPFTFLGWTYHFDKAPQARFERWRFSWQECKDSNGYPPNVPIWLSAWLLIIADNVIHILINAIAIAYC